MIREFPLEMMPEAYLDRWLALVKDDPEQLSLLPEAAKAVLLLYERHKTGLTAELTLAM